MYYRFWCGKKYNKVQYNVNSLTQTSKWVVMRGAICSAQVNTIESVDETRTKKGKRCM
jgi:hypothetical protein